jgi:isopentenyldiphosphate isomerase
MTDGPSHELVDLIDAEDNVTGTVTRAEMRAGRLKHRATYVAVRSGDGRLLVHRRAAHKDLWPSRWDVAVGGVVGAGEDWAFSAVREVAEEIGVTVTVDDLHPVGMGWFADPDCDVRGWVAELVHDGPFTFADGEIVEARFVDRAELDDLRASQPFVPDSLQLVLPRIAF